MIDNKVLHSVVDAKTHQPVELEIDLDYHGLTVRLPSGGVLILDVSGGEVSVDHMSDPYGEIITRLGRVKYE